ncbi:hypothetical protein JCM3766R1_002448, partial [Sporobolomyces carnicolor]
NERFYPYAVPDHRRAVWYLRKVSPTQIQQLLANGRDKRVVEITPMPAYDRKNLAPSVQQHLEQGVGVRRNAIYGRRVVG